LKTILSTTMCDLAGGAIAAVPREGPPAELARLALQRAMDRYGSRVGTTLEEELAQVPANVRAGERRPRAANTWPPFDVLKIDVPLGAELSMVDEARSEYLTLLIDHPEAIQWLANDPSQRMAVAPNWKLHVAALKEAVANPFTIGANHPTYLRQMGLSSPTLNPTDPVTVAVLDNGFDDAFWSGAPSPVPIGPGLDLIPGGAGSSGHGTLVSALIAESAPGAVVEPIRMGGDDSTEWDALHALARAVDIDAAVIALSYRQILVDTPCGTCGLVRQTARSEVFAKLLGWAASANGQNRAVLVAAGNDKAGDIALPAAYEKAIPATALDTTGTALASFANWDASGTLPVLALPGDDVAVDTQTNADIAGTSFATAYAAAMFAEAMMRWGTTDAPWVTSQLVAVAATVSNAQIPVLP
jgi:hypothetical protein